MKFWRSKFDAILERSVEGYYFCSFLSSLLLSAFLAVFSGIVLLGFIPVSSSTGIVLSFYSSATLNSSFIFQVYEWMNKRATRYIITTSDTAIQLDLIAKVNGVPSAEQYFLNLSNSLKDRKIYGSLLNAYVHVGMQEKAESLMRKMRNRGYATETLQFNVMMTLYMKLKEHDKIELLVSEMMEKNIPLDTCTYNIWLSSCGYQGSVAKMEQVFEQMKLETNISPNWTTFSTMATMCIKLGNLEKAEDYLRRAETAITGRGYTPYHYLISLYGSAGNKEEVYRVWNAYNASFVNIPNMGFCTMISALLKMDDIVGAEKVYDEWLSFKSKYDPRLGNLLLSWYVRKGLSHKMETFFDQMVEAGGKPDSMSWEIVSEDHIRNMRIPKAVSCLQHAVKCEGSKWWRPKPRNVSAILKICEEKGDTTSKDALMELLRWLGCLDDSIYMSHVVI